MGDSESGTGTTPVIGRVAVGISAAAALIIVGMFIADALSTSPTVVLSGTAQSGPFELLAIGLHFSVILGLIFAGNSLTRPDPDYGKVLNLFRRNDTSGLNEAAPACRCWVVRSWPIGLASAASSCSCGDAMRPRPASAS